MLRDKANVLAKPISEIRNLCAKHLRPQTDFQIAKLKQLLKKGSTTHRKTYRSISLLPLISKIIEKMIHNQTHPFSDEIKILYRFQ